MASRENYVDSLTIARAVVRSMNVLEVLENFDITFSQYYKIRFALIDRLMELCDEDETNIRVAQRLLQVLLKQEFLIPSHKRRSLDNIIAQLVALLPPIEQTSHGIQFIQHRRSSRRRAGLMILSKDFQPEYKQMFLDIFSRFHDEWALTTLSRVDIDISDIAEMMLSNIQRLYEQARVFEKLLSQDYKMGIELASEYPIAFVWGTGRAKCDKALPDVIRILHQKETENDYEHYGLIVWALGRLRARTELWRLAADFHLHNDLPGLANIDCKQHQT